MTTENKMLTPKEFQESMLKQFPRYVSDAERRLQECIADGHIGPCVQGGKMEGPFSDEEFDTMKRTVSPAPRFVSDAERALAPEALRDACEAKDLGLDVADEGVPTPRQCPFCQGDGDWKGEVCAPCGGTGDDYCGVLAQAGYVSDAERARPETDRERADRLVRAIIAIKEMAAKRSRVNMPDGLSLQAFCAITLQDFPMMGGE